MLYWINTVLQKMKCVFKKGMVVNDLLLSDIDWQTSKNSTILLN